MTNVNNLPQSHTQVTTTLEVEKIQNIYSENEICNNNVSQSGETNKDNTMQQVSVKIIGEKTIASRNNKEDKQI